MEQNHTMKMDMKGDMTGNEKGSDMGGHMMSMGNLKQKFWVSLVVAIPVLLFSPMMGIHASGLLSFPGASWVVLVLATFLFFYGGRPFLSGAKMELKMKSPAMMTLIAMGIIVSYGYSIYAFIANNILRTIDHKMEFFWELATLIVIMLLGHWVEMRAVGRAGNALQKMAELLPGSAHLIQQDGSTKDVPLQEVRVGQQVTVKLNERIPTDGKIVSGETTVNESMVTGESRAIKKGVGATVIGGSLNGNGTLVIEVTGTGESGYLAQVMKLVRDAQQDKSRVESISDKVAKALFYVALFVGILAFILWLIIDQDLNTALTRMVTVFIIACPHALGLAIPLVIARSTSLGATHGLLIRNRNALEIARKINVVTMDKTGTLTEGNFRINELKTLSDKWNEGQVISMMAALEIHSDHPLAQGIVEEVQKRNSTMAVAQHVTLIDGTGLMGEIDNAPVKLVAVTYLNRNRIPYDSAEFDRLARQGNSISYLLWKEEAIGLVAQGDQVKPEAGETIEALRKEHIVSVMLTGDNPTSAMTIAKTLGIDNVHASLLPGDKEKVIEEYQQKGEKVMMVGDGVNDAPALARADIGVAIGAGTDVAIDSADVVLVQSNPYDIIHFLSLAKRTSSKMVQNLWWAAGYNIIAIPLAAGILAPVGIVLSPAMGAIFMSLSTVIVAVNALSLKMK
ncbi:heavy metal translocating P-type ATPase [Gabonibacter massiliensis]|uniref:heavy metal translocating P-type ATPase n=1 Tax=Gabonibacter massiliensis TaxID=1720195 RepID=UPI00073F4312|nr:heavy metal translocating P-type ATPase [Gabonibacter massiliensis]